MCEVIHEVFRDEFMLGNEAGRAEGKAEGKAEGEQNLLKKLLSMGAITPEIAAQFMPPASATAQ